MTPSRTALFLCFLLAAPGAAQEKGFPFPQDAAGKRLSQILEPAFLGDPLQVRSQPLPRSPLDAVEDPRSPAKPISLHPIRPKLPPAGIAQPLHPGEGLPLEFLRVDPKLPQSVRFAVRPPLSWPSSDPTRRTNLPILARPTSDPGGLLNPIENTSFDSLLARPLPLRTTPAPFQALQVPEPFEFHNVVRLPTLTEDHLPAVPGTRLK